MNLRENIFSMELLKDAMRKTDKTELNVLRLIKGEIARGEDASKKLNDSEITSLLKKMVDNLNLYKTDTSELEIEIISKFLPKQLSDSELETLLKVYVSENSLSTINDMGKVMGYLKTNYSGMYDGVTANKVLKTLLS